MFGIGCFIGFCGCLWIFLGCNVNVCDRTSSFATTQTYGVAICIGAATSTLLVASLSLTADLIGSNTECSAFIYGFMSLTDKVQMKNYHRQMIWGLAVLGTWWQRYRGSRRLRIFTKFRSIPVKILDIGDDVFNFIPTYTHFY